MGIPQSYSRELPERCLRLIEALLPSVANVRVPGEEHLGPLKTTFLLALATPIIVLPIERVERHRNRQPGYMDDRHLDPTLATAVDDALGGRPLRCSPFFADGQWRFARVPYRGENLAQHFTSELADALEAGDAGPAASAMPAAQWASCLRNALAHGGVAYLDQHGRQSFGGVARKLAFVSASYPDGDVRQPPQQLRVLRIDEEPFLLFLRAWVSWLSDSGLSQALAA